MKATNTNNTNRKNYDLGAIMRRAWAIRKAAAAEKSCKVSEIPMGECLRMAWAEAEGVNAKINATATANEWAAMSDSEQVKMMSACIRKAAKNRIRYSTEDHYLQYSEVPAFGCYGPHNFDEFLGETTIRVINSLDISKLTTTNERRAAKAKKPITLVSVVYRAASASIEAIYYQDSKHGAAYDYEISDGEGNTTSAMEMVASVKDNTESAAIFRAELKRFYKGQDEIGRKILALLVQYKTEREIAAEVGISNVAVHKRIVKMRAALEHLRTA